MKSIIMTKAISLVLLATIDETLQGLSSKLAASAVVRLSLVGRVRTGGHLRNLGTATRTALGRFAVVAEGSFDIQPKTTRKPRLA